MEKMRGYLEGRKKCLRMKFFAYNPILSNRRLRWKKRIEEQEEKKKKKQRQQEEFISGQLDYRGIECV